MGNLGNVPNWEVTGEYDTVDNRGKKISERFCQVFDAKNKADAVNQAKKHFAGMQKADPDGKYNNFRKISAKPYKR